MLLLTRQVSLVSRQFRNESLSLASTVVALRYQLRETHAEFLRQQHS